MESGMVGGDNWGIISTGPDAVNIQTVLPRTALVPIAEVAAPAALVSVPQHGGVFVGRDTEIAALADVLDDRLRGAASMGGGDGRADGGRTVVVAAVHGLGGVGKSALAAQYALRQAARRNPVWWITADSPTSITAGLASLAAALQTELADVLPLDKLARRGLEWLATHDEWLLVLDNVVDSADVEPLFRRQLPGRVVLTSRLSEGWHRFETATVLHLDVLDHDHAVAMLAGLAGAGNTAVDLSGIAELVDALGRLPLALEQVGAYLHQTRISPAVYLRLLREQPAALYGRTAVGSDAEHTLAKVWRTSLDRLSATPLAGRILRILAWFGPEEIPRSLLDGLSQGDSEAAGGVEVVEALGRLSAYNMIKLDGEVLQIHRLVQAVARTPDELDPHRRPADVAAARRDALALVKLALPPTSRDPATWSVWRGLIPHVDALATRTAASDGADGAVSEIDAGFVLSRTGAFLRDQGAVGRSIAHLRQAQEILERELGRDQAAPLANAVDLGDALLAAGDTVLAVELLTDSLERCERVLGTTHLISLACRDALARALVKTDRRAQAVGLLSSTVTELARQLGEDHPDTLRIERHLADALMANGRQSRAGDSLGEILRIQEASLGRDHPEALQTRKALAEVFLYGQWLGSTGWRVEELRTLVGDFERVYSSDHPETLAVRVLLARSAAKDGQLDTAISLMEPCARDCLRILGVQHPLTQSARATLARFFSDSDEPARAVPILREVLADNERMFGIEDARTVDARSALGIAYLSTDDPETGIALMERACREAERVLGPTHEQTLIMLTNLPHAFLLTGRPTKAVELFEGALDVCMAAVGEDHWLVRATQRHLESTRAKLAQQ